MTTIAAIPANLRVPLATFSIEPAQAPYSDTNTLLLVGHKGAGASMASDIPVLVNDDIRGVAGTGSMLVEMFNVARANSAFQKIAIAAVPEPTGVAASATITVGSALESGTLYWYINGQRYSIGVVKGDGPAAIQSAIVAEINSGQYLDAPVIASQAGTVVTISAKFKGVVGNTMSLELGRVGDEGPLSEEVLTVTAFQGGTGTPDLSNLLANLGDEEYDVKGVAFSDTTTLNELRDFHDGVSGTWSAMQELYGHAVVASEGSYSALTTKGTARNDPHATIMGTYKTGSPAWVWAAAVSGVLAARMNGVGVNLSTPMHATVLKGVYGPKSIADRFDKVERQSFYFDGISSYRVNKSGEVIIDRLITTYQTNAWDVPDASWLDVNTMFQSFMSVRYLKAKVTGAFSEVALADEDPFAIDELVTPDEVRDTLLHGYSELISLGVVENYDAFETALSVKRNTIDANRVDATIPFDTVNQLRVFAGQVITHLQLGSTN